MIGNGHFVRTKNLYDKFQNRNYKVKLIINDIKKLFNYRNYLLVYDSPKSNYRDMNKLFNSGIQVICFDWFFSFKPYINISIYAHKPVLSSFKSYVGTEYINLRKEVLTLKKNNLSNKKILVVLGSGDKRKQTDTISNFLYKKGFRVSIIKGKYSENNKGNNNIKQYINPNNFLKLLNDHEYIITNGGTCLFEANYLGKKTFVLPQTKKEQIIAKMFYKKKSILGYGLKNLKKNYSTLLNDKNKIKKIVDGKGIKKIYKIISNQI